MALIRNSTQGSLFSCPEGMIAGVATLATVFVALQAIAFFAPKYAAAHLGILNLPVTPLAQLLAHKTAAQVAVVAGSSLIITALFSAATYSAFIKRRDPFGSS